MQLVAVQGDRQETRQRPEDHDEALQIHAADHPYAGGHLVLCRTGGGHARSRSDDRHQVRQRHGHDGVPGVFPHRGRTEQVEHVIRNRGVQPGKSSDPGQSHRDQQQRKQDDQNALNHVRDHRRDESSHHRVKGDNQGVHGVDEGGISVGNEGAQLATLHAVGKLVKAQLLGRAQDRAGLATHAQTVEFPELLDAAPFLRAVMRFRLRSQGHHRLGCHHVADANADYRHDQGEDGKSGGEKPAAKAFLKVIANGQQADATKPEGGEPVKGR